MIACIVRLLVLFGASLVIPPLMSPWLKASMDLQQGETIKRWICSMSQLRESGFKPTLNAIRRRNVSKESQQQTQPRSERMLEAAVKAVAAFDQGDDQMAAGWIFYKHDPFTSQASAREACCSILPYFQAL